MNRMSGLNRLLSRRDKNAQGDDRHKKVMSLPTPKPSSASDTSSSFVSTGTFTRSSSLSRRKSSSSLSSLCLAFTAQTPKRSPSLQAVEGTIHSSTANAYEHLLLQPKQTAGLLHGLFPEEERKSPVKDDEKKACPSIRSNRVCLTICRLKLFPSVSLESVLQISKNRILVMC